MLCAKSAVFMCMRCNLVLQNVGIIQFKIVKVLLKNGANPELRDEEGKTALDKARERTEEGHQQVSAILESPSSYMQKDETG